jgi:hypothetical protein
MDIRIKNNIYWVGKPTGNSGASTAAKYPRTGVHLQFVSRREGKTALIDTVGLRTQRNMSPIGKDTRSQKNDYIIANHVGGPQWGAPGSGTGSRTPVTARRGREIAEGQYHKDWNFKSSRPGPGELVQRTCLHRARASMAEACLLPHRRALLSANDFGQHYADRIAV